MPEPATTNFISASWIKPLWKKLIDVRDDRKKELDSMANEFGDPFILARYYVPPHCQHHNPADYDELEAISFVRSPIFETINHFLRGDFAIQGDGRSQMFILSDAGMGKTSLLLMLKLSHLTAFWPHGYNCVLIKLGATSVEAIRAIKDRARTVLLLDALDEDPAAWGKIEDRLREILSETTTFRRVLISCRTQFFPEGATDPFGLPGRVKVSGYSCPVVYLSLFDDAQVESYLSKRFPNYWFHLLLGKHNTRVTKSREILSRMKSLRFRPLLLAHIDYILEAPTERWNEYTIYRALVDSWLMREERKTGFQRSLSSESLWRACVLIAETMQRTASTAIPPEELKRLLIIHPELEQLTHIDVGGRSLLNRRSDGAFRFSHYTIQEFLLVHAAITGQLSCDIIKIRITNQMLRFFLFGNCLGVKISQVVIDTFTENMHSADLNGLDLSGLILPGARLKKATLAGAVLEGAKLDGADLTGADMRRVNLRKANLAGAKLESSDLREANCQSAIFSGTNFRNADLRGADFRKADLLGSNMSGAIGAPERGGENNFFESIFGKLGSANFTPRAQQILALARIEADRLEHNYVGTGHLMLGLIRLNQGVAVNVLKKMNFDAKAFQLEIEQKLRSDPEANVQGIIPYTQRVRKVLVAAGIEAQALKHSYVGTEHLLLGILREGEGMAARVLKKLNIEIEEVRHQIFIELEPNFLPPTDED